MGRGPLLVEFKFLVVVYVLQPCDVLEVGGAAVTVLHLVVEVECVELVAGCAGSGINDGEGRSADGVTLEFGLLS